MGSVNGFLVTHIPGRDRGDRWRQVYLAVSRGAAVTFWKVTARITLPSTLMLHKVAHKNLIDSNPLFERKTGQIQKSAPFSFTYFAPYSSRPMSTWHPEWVSDFSPSLSSCTPPAAELRHILCG